MTPNLFKIHMYKIIN